MDIGIKFKRLTISLVCLLLILALVSCGPQDKAKVVTPVPNLTHEEYLMRGDDYCDLGQYEKAVQDYDEAIRLNPQFAVAYNNRGVAYEWLGQKEKAYRDFAKAWELRDK